MEDRDGPPYQKSRRNRLRNVGYARQEWRAIRPKVNTYGRKLGLLSNSERESRAIPIYGKNFADSFLYIDHFFEAGEFLL